MMREIRQRRRALVIRFSFPSTIFSLAWMETHSSCRPVDDAIFVISIDGVIDLPVRETKMGREIEALAAISSVMLVTANRRR